MELCAQLSYVKSSGEQECSDPTSEQFDFISQVQVKMVLDYDTWMQKDEYVYGDGIEVAN